MLYLFYGEDDFTSREMAAAARTRHADPAVGDLATRIIDGETCSWNDVVGACSVLPFLTNLQIVEIRGLLGSAGGMGKGGTGEPAQDRVAPAAPGKGAKASRRVPPPAQVAQFVAAVPLTTVLILVEGALNPTNPYIKALQEAHLAEAVISYNAPLQPAATGRWLQERARAAGVSLEGQAVGLLIATHKSDLWALRSELAKLVAYVGPGGAITATVVGELVPAAAEATVYKLLDTMTARRLDTALPLLRRLLDGGAAPEYIMAVLSGRFRDWLLGTGRVPRPSGLTDARLADFFNALLCTDRVLKTGSSDDRFVVMDLLVTVLTERLPSALLEDAFISAAAS